MAIILQQTCAKLIREHFSVVPMDFSSNVAAQLNAGTILPEGIVIITLLLVLIVDLIGGRKVVFALPYLAIAGLLGATGTLVLAWSTADRKSVV